MLGGCVSECVQGIGIGKVGGLREWDGNDYVVQCDAFVVELVFDVDFASAVV